MATPTIPPGGPLVRESWKQLAVEADRRKKSQDMAERATRNFREFMPLAWSTVEPAKPYLSNWHMDAQAEHAQAVADGQVKKLAVIVPPGASKSIVWAVQFPAWMWTPKRNPGWRSTFASYSSDLSTRDSVRCRDLLQSIWYRETFKPDWSFATDQNVKTFFVNSAKGHRFSTSVGATATGFRGDAIICLPGDVRITTEKGPMPIRSIVDGELPVKVLSFNHDTGRPEWRNIERYESASGRASVHVNFSNGASVECTDDHPIYVCGRGYIQADAVRPGERVLCERDLLRLFGTDQRSVTIAHCESEAPLLLSEMRGHMAHRPKQSGLCRRATESSLPAVRRRIHRKGEHLEASWSKGRMLLLAGVRRQERGGASEVRITADGAVRSLRNNRKAGDARADQQDHLLLPAMQELCPQVEDERDRKSQLPAREWLRGVSGGVQKNLPSDQEARQIPLPNLRQDARRDAMGSGRSPHRLRQAAQRSGESPISMSRVPCGGARNATEEAGRSAVVVESIDRIATPKRVFNLKIAGNHNYFANGILLHNCDDPLKAGDRNSEAMLAGVIDWWTNEMFNRLNDMATGAKVVIMQRLSDRDLAGHILREGGYEVLMIPMEYEPGRSRVTSIGWQDPRKEPGELMFPALFPREVVDELKKNASTYRTQYQQDPSGAGGSVLKPHLWNYWQPPGANLPPVRVKMPDNSIDERRAVPLPDAFDVELISFDCTFKDVKESDYVVGMGAKVRGAQRFVFDHCRDRMDLPATISAVRAMAGRMPGAHLKLIEDKANGPAVIQMLQKELTGLVGVNPEGGKVTRAAGASVELQAGNWYLPHPMMAPWVGNPESPTDGGFLAESVLFPFGANDDQVDAWSQMAIYLQKLQVGGEFGVSEKDIRVDPLEIPEKWPRIFGVAINWRELGAVWLARQPDTNQHYLYASFTAGGNDPAKYAAEMKKQGDWIPGVMHAKAPGRDEQSGHALISTYQKLGVSLEGVPDDVAAELAEMARALRAGELKILNAVPAVFDQFRMFRRDEKGKLPDVNCGTIMAMCVAWRARSRMRVKPEPAKPRQTNYMTGGPENSWMGS